MNTSKLNTEEAPNKWWAARDAHMRNICNKTLWDDDVLLQVDRMAGIMDMLYYGKVHKRFGKRQVTLKIERARVKDKRLIAEMEAHWAEQGISKKVTAQGIIYRIR